MIKLTTAIRVYDTNSLTSNVQKEQQIRQIFLMENHFHLLIYIYIYIYKNTRVVQKVLSLMKILVLLQTFTFGWISPAQKWEQKSKQFFSCFIRRGSVLPQQKCSVIHLLSGWGEEHFERSIYIYIYIYVCVCVCVCKKWSFFVGPREQKVNISKWIGPQRDLYFFRIIYFVLTYVYVSSLLLSSENI